MNSHIGAGRVYVKGNSWMYGYAGKLGTYMIMIIGLGVLVMADVHCMTWMALRR